jgi:hypothetical protein
MVGDAKRKFFMIEDQFIEVRHVETGTIYKRTDGILVFRQSKNFDQVTIAQLQQQLDVFLEIQKGAFSPLIVVVNKLSKLENDEKIFLISSIAKFSNKVCVVANTPVPVFIFNILFFLSRPAVPSKVVKSEEEALKWIMEN